MAPPLSSLTRSLGRSAVVEFRRIADQLQAKGINIVDLGIGEPSAHSPSVAIDAMTKAARDGHDKYVDPSGLIELREAIADFETTRHGLRCSAQDIVVTTGSVGALSLASRALVGPGDEVLLPEPCYGPYRNQIRLTGAEPIGVAMPVIEDRVQLDISALRDALTDRTKAIIVNTPWNPCGRVLDAQELGELAQLCIDADLWLIADEVYSELIYAPHTHASVAALGAQIAERTVTVNSASKAFAMTGWRLGYCVAPAQVASVLSTINHLTTRCATSFVQYGALAAYRHASEHVAAECESYRQRRDLMVGLIAEIPGLNCPQPEGTFYAFARFPEAFGDSRKVANEILEQQGVIVTPGSAYGPSTSDFIRLSFATSEQAIREGMDRLARYFARHAS